MQLRFVLHCSLHSTMSSADQGGGFVEVTHGSKKCETSNSPTLPSQSKPGYFEPPLGTPIRPKAYRKNTVPVITSGVDNKFKS